MKHLIERGKILRHLPKYAGRWGRCQDLARIRGGTRQATPNRPTSRALVKPTRSGRAAIVVDSLASVSSGVPPRGRGSGLRRGRGRSLSDDPYARGSRRVLVAWTAGPSRDPPGAAPGRTTTQLSRLGCASHRAELAQLGRLLIVDTGRCTWMAIPCVVFVSDLRHVLDMPEEVPVPARRMGEHLTLIVRAATAGEGGQAWLSALPCRRRPDRRPCPGHFALLRADVPPSIEWRCTACGGDGVIRGWEGSVFDLRPRRPELVSTPSIRMVVPAEVAATL